MAGEKYADKAVASVAAWVEAKLPTQLRAVETAKGLNHKSLTDPIDYIPADIPSDQRSPIVEIFAEDGFVIDHRNNLDSYKVILALSFTGDCDLEASQLKARHYMTALIDTIRQDHVMGGTICAAIDREREFHQFRGPNSTTRHTIVLGIETRVHDP